MAGHTIIVSRSHYATPPLNDFPLIKGVTRTALALLNKGLTVSVLSDEPMSEKLDELLEGIRMSRLTWTNAAISHQNIRRQFAMAADRLAGDDQSATRQLLVIFIGNEVLNLHGVYHFATDDIVRLNEVPPCGQYAGGYSVDQLHSDVALGQWRKVLVIFDTCYGDSLVDNAAHYPPCAATLEDTTAESFQQTSYQVVASKGLAYADGGSTVLQRALQRVWWRNAVEPAPLTPIGQIVSLVNAQLPDHLDPYEQSCAVARLPWGDPHTNIGEFALF